MNRNTLLKIFFGAICVFMLAETIHTSLQTSLWDALPRMLHDPWTVATLIDFYLNILILASVVYLKERSWARVFLWLLAFIALGSIATSGYVVLQLFKLKPNDPLQNLVLPNPQ